VARSISHSLGGWFLVIIGINIVFFGGLARWTHDEDFSFEKSATKKMSKRMHLQVLEPWKVDGIL
jgi:hypothetical protein